MYLVFQPPTPPPGCQKLKPRIPWFPTYIMYFLTPLYFCNFILSSIHHLSIFSCCCRGSNSRSDPFSGHRRRTWKRSCRRIRRRRCCHRRLHHYRWSSVACSLPRSQSPGTGSPYPTLLRSDSRWYLCRLVSLTRMSGSDIPRGRLEEHRIQRNNQKRKAGKTENVFVLQVAAHIHVAWEKITATEKTTGNTAKKNRQMGNVEW